mgnify:CR=1 FL=1
MKINFKILLIAAFLVTAPLLMLAQNPPHPNNGGAPGTGNTPVGGSPSGAPIGGGAEILVTLGIAYAISKYRASKKEE